MVILKTRNRLMPMYPFGMGAKAEVIQSSLPFGVGSFSDSVTEVAIPIGEQDYEEDSVEEEPAVIEHDVEEHTEVDEEPQILEPQGLDP